MKSIHETGSAAAKYHIETSQWGGTKKNQFARDLLDNVFTNLKKHSDVLEIGPGLGHFADECAKRQYKYVAIEPSESMASALKDRGHHVIVQSVPPIPCSDHSFDFVLANHVLEHQPTYVDAMKFIIEIKRALKPGGCSCIAFPNWLKMKNIFHEMDYSHNYITTKLRVTQLVSNGGLRIENVYHTNGQMVLRKGFWGWFRRTPYMMVQWIANWNMASIIAENFGQETLLLKVRKTVSESIYMVVKS